jgi:hypothetical protein
MNEAEFCLCALPHRQFNESLKGSVFTTIKQLKTGLLSKRSLAVHQKRKSLKMFIVYFVYVTLSLYCVFLDGTN